MVLIGILIIVVGFALQVNPLVVVTVAGIITGLIGGIPVTKLLTDFGKAFTENRYMSILLLTLPVVGLLEDSGLQSQAKILISKIKSISVSKILIIYMFFRELTIALGLPLGGQAQTVRPLVSPMAEGAAESKFGKVADKDQQQIRAYSASTDNIGNFFGQDIFIAVGAILLMTGVFKQDGVQADPIKMALWGLPTAIFAFIIHSVRLHMFERKLEKKYKK